MEAKRSGGMVLARGIKRKRMRSSSAFCVLLCAMTWFASTGSVGAIEINQKYLESEEFKEALRRAQSKDAPRPAAKRMATCMAAVANKDFCTVHWNNFVAEPGSPEALKEQEALRSSLEESDKIFREKVVPALQEGEQWADVERANARKRSAECMATFGSEQFCSCLNNEVHFLVDFQTYVRVITSDARPVPAPKTEEERLLNSIFRAREACAAVK